MSLRKIVVYDDPSLRRKSRRVRRVGPEVRELIDDMLDTMHVANGIGLAAIQVGVPERIIVLEVPEESEEDDTGAEASSSGGDSSSDEAPSGDEAASADGDPSEDGDRQRPCVRYVVINPEIARRSRQKEERIEGCLSVPGLVGEVARHESVTVKGIDPQGRSVRIKAEGLLARAFQHEIDHCNGVLFLDHIDDPEKIWSVTEGEEEAAEAAQEVPGRGGSSGPLV
jgi:peptide deformylase